MIRITEGPFWVVLIGACWLALFAASAVRETLPASYWYAPGELIVRDAQIGQCPKITFNREIRRPFSGSWGATLLRQQPSGRFSVYDTFSGSLPYNPESSLPDDPDLGWWFEIPSCNWPSGIYRVFTKWTIQPDSGGKKSMTRTSTTFEITVD